MNDNITVDYKELLNRVQAIIDKQYRHYISVAKAPFISNLWYESKLQKARYDAMVEIQDEIYSLIFPVDKQ